MHVIWKYRILLAGFFLVSAVSVWLYGSGKPRTVLTICAPNSPVSALAVLAQSRGFFASEGLDVKIHTETLGKQCIENLIAGQVDFAVSNVGPVVSALTLANPLVVISEVQSSTHHVAIVYHKELDSAHGLIGKKIAIVKGTDAKLLMRLLVKADPDMTHANVKIIKTNTLAEAQDLFARKAVDATVMWEPYLSEFLKAGPPNYYQAEDSPFFTEFSLLVGTQDFSTQHSALIDQMMRALSRAQRYYDENTKDARECVARALKFDTGKIDENVWSKLKIGLGLSSVLVSMMNESQQAMIANQDFEPAESSLIDLSQSLYPQALRKINKEVVTYE